MLALRAVSSDSTDSLRGRMELVRRCFLVTASNRLEFWISDISGLLRPNLEPGWQSWYARSLTIRSASVGDVFMLSYQQGTRACLTRLLDELTTTGNEAAWRRLVDFVAEEFADALFNLLSDL